MADTLPSTVRNPWLEGVHAPVHEEHTTFDLQVTGSLPVELDGRFLRNGPNPVSTPDPTTHHWFTGDGMVHGLRLRDGRAEWYRNRWVRSPDVADALGEPRPPSPYADDVRLFAANTHVIGFGGRTYALVEAGTPPVELTDELDTVGPTDFGGSLEHPFTAHPKLDPATGRLHAVSYFWGWGNQVRYQVLGPDGRIEHATDLATTGPTMVHDVSITETRVLVYDLPCLFDVDAAMAGVRLPYRWDPTYPARVGVLPLGGVADEVQWVDVEPCWVFPPMNAYDDGTDVVVDLVRWDSMFNTHLLGPSEGQPRLERWTIDPAAGSVRTEVIDDRGQEFPRVDERLVGRRHRYGYAAEIGSCFAPGAALRHDLRAGTTERHDFGPGRTTGELVHVPAGPDSDEDDGWLLSFVHDAASDRSELVVLAAGDFTGDPVATVHLPARVPSGFHGSWVPSSSS